jgi:tetratricopeptide (TPR) repeat protein
VELGNLYSSIGRKDAAATAYERAIEFYLKMRELHPDSFYPVANLGAACVLLGRFGLATERRAETRAVLERVISALAPPTGPDARSSSQVLRFVYASRARALGLVGRHSEALADWDRAIQFADESTGGDFRLSRASELARSRNYRQAEAEVKSLANAASIPIGRRAYDLACIAALSSAAARGDITLPPAERDARAEDFAARAIGWLAQARDAGFFRDPSKIVDVRTDTDLDSLRSRSDFQLLIMDLSFPNGAFAERTDQDR